MPDIRRTDGMRWIEKGTFTMGSLDWYPEEGPLRKVRVDGFWIDESPVSNREFAEFVDATGHVTMAEKEPDPRLYPGILPEMQRPGSLVFKKHSVAMPMADLDICWKFEIGASWRSPHGPESDLESLGLWDHPVVHVAWSDAAAYAKWVGKDLPTEAEHEFASRGGFEGKDYAWGDELAPDGQILANYWRGEFPWVNANEGGRVGTSPVRSYPPNGYGIFDLIGNVWEWTRDWWSEDHKVLGKKRGGACCVVGNPRGGRLADSYDPCQPLIRIGRKVLKGGSHLCAPNYCRRYRPAARQPVTMDTSSSHIGFRCVLRSA